jgi:hypothetical protein
MALATLIPAHVRPGIQLLLQRLHCLEDGCAPLAPPRCAQTALHMLHSVQQCEQKPQPRVLRMCHIAKRCCDAPCCALLQCLLHVPSRIVSAGWRPHVGRLHRLCLRPWPAAASKSAEVDSAAAAKGDYDKEEEYRRDIDDGVFDWEPVVMEAAGRLGKGAMRVINNIAKIAAGSDREACIFAARTRGAELGLSAWERLCVEKKGLQAMANGGGHCFQMVISIHSWCGLR